MVGILHVIKIYCYYEYKMLQFLKSILWVKYC